MPLPGSSMAIQTATSMSCFRGPIAVTTSKPWPENDAYNVPHHARLGRSIAVNVALHFERPFFAVLAPSERLGHITGLAADLDAPVSRSQLSEGRHACALRLSCALCVPREVKTGTDVCNLG